MIRNYKKFRLSSMTCGHTSWFDKIIISICARTYGFGRIVATFWKFHQRLTVCSYLLLRLLMCLRFHTVSNCMLWIIFSTYINIKYYKTNVGNTQLVTFLCIGSLNFSEYFFEGLVGVVQSMVHLPKFFKFVNWGRTADQDRRRGHGKGSGIRGKSGPHFPQEWNFDVIQSST